MRFTIVGAGAIGGITGAHLIRAGHEVTFVGDYEAPGRVVFGPRGGFHVGVLDGQISGRLRAVAAALGTVQECEASSNVLGCLWSKMAMASVFFATALVDADVAEILGRER